MECAATHASDGPRAPVAPAAPSGPRGPRAPPRAAGAMSFLAIVPLRILPDVTDEAFSSRLPTLLRASA